MALKLYDFYIWPDSFKDDSLTLGPISTNTF